MILVKLLCAKYKKNGIKSDPVCKMFDMNQTNCQPSYFQIVYRNFRENTKNLLLTDKWTRIYNCYHTIYDKPFNFLLVTFK